MPAPIIGVTTYSRNEGGQFHVPCAYLDALRTAGAVPIALTPGESDLDSLLTVLDGLLLSGGGDIEPALYDGEPHHTVYAVDPERDEFELSLAQQCLNLHLPVLGVCRGLQILNVVCGGSLVLHIPDQYGDEVLHRTEHPRQPVEHPVQVNTDSRLAEIFQETHVNVVSWHHQSIQTLAEGWLGVAYAPDGVMEAIEHCSHPWAIAVQWHPELSATTCQHQQQLFASLVSAARKYRTA
jgi:putative glutamine amidotransferase